MTRINYGIKPTQLSDQLLRAELRELPRIFGLVVARIEKDKPFDSIPKDFILGRGHVTFFFDKVKYLVNRINNLEQEHMSRFGKLYYNDEYRSLNKERVLYVKHSNISLYNDCEETKEGRQLVVDRILMLSYGYKRPHTHTGRTIEDWAKLLNS